jgi:hypothetical protein
MHMLLRKWSKVTLLQLTRYGTPLGCLMALPSNTVRLLQTNDEYTLQNATIHLAFAATGQN